jgi:hypothetical protein
MPTRTADAEWNGDLLGGNGKMAFGSVLKARLA